MMNKTIEEKLKLLPELPGSYQMLDGNQNIIYVGKAKNLKNRVRSYFIGSHDQKTQRLVLDIEDFTYLVTASERDAFLLELSLIKEHQPKYNIMLMDDKTYPYLEITSETHPRLQITRKITKKSKTLFGPYPDVYSARVTYHLLNRIFPLRKCINMPKKVCLYYHMNQCLGPCEHEVDPKEYQEMIYQIKTFLNGNSTLLQQEIKAKMLAHSEKLEFEKAKEYREILDSINKTSEKQQVIFHDLLSRDIISYDVYDQYLAITFLFMRQGKIIFSQNDLFTIYDDPEEAVLTYIHKFYEKNLIPKEILLPEGLDISYLNETVSEKIIQPKQGKKYHLLELAKQNANIYLQNNIQNYLKKHAKSVGALEALGNLIGLEPPKRIECFDNSNMMGSNPVSAMIVFTNGLPDKKEYRKYVVKTVKGPDDYHTMQEIIYRRYQRMLMENTIWPDLIIMDGGITQVRAAKQILSELYIDIPVIGLKKDRFHKTDAIIGLNEEEIPLDKHDFLFVLLSKIQDEAHRFAITFHRNQKAKQIYASILDAIPGVGKQTKTKLLTTFKTIENIKNATDFELKEIGINQKAIDNLRIALNSQKETK